MDISVHDNEVVTEYGIEDGAIQTAIYPYESNSLRSAEEQAEAEAKSKFARLVKYNGYRVDPDDIDTANFIKPMKAHKYSEQKHKLKWPLYVQPKLDGMRCLAFRQGDSIFLTSGLGNDITTMDHIKEELLKVMEVGETWDGELYCHGMPLPKILGIVKANKVMKPLEERQQIKYHVFDCITDEPFIDRIMQTFRANGNFIKKVDTYLINEEEEVFNYTAFIEQGYEGMMYRNVEGFYVGKRSYDILKRKDFKDNDFKIVGCTEGKGGLDGCLVSFECLVGYVDGFGVTFDAPLGKGWTHERMRELLIHPEMWRGKFAKVKYLCLSEDGIPQIPKTEAIRDAIGLD